MFRKQPPQHPAENTEARVLSLLSTYVPPHTPSRLKPRPKAHHSPESDSDPPPSDPWSSPLAHSSHKASDNYHLPKISKPNWENLLLNLNTDTVSFQCLIITNSSRHGENSEDTRAVPVDNPTTCGLDPIQLVRTIRLLPQHLKCHWKEQFSNKEIWHFFFFFCNNHNPRIRRSDGPCFLLFVAIICTLFKYWPCDRRKEVQACRFGKAQLLNRHNWQRWSYWVSQSQQPQ